MSMNEVFKKMYENGVTVTIEPRFDMDCFYIWFSKGNRTSINPLRIGMTDWWDYGGGEMVELLLSELDYFLRRLEKYVDYQNKYRRIIFKR